MDRIIWVVEDFYRAFGGDDDVAGFSEIPRQDLDGYVTVDFAHAACA